MKLAVVMSVLISGLVCAGAGNAGAPHGSTLRADVAEWSIVPSTGAVHAGQVRLVVHNLGETIHQVTVARTSSFSARLPLSGARAAARPLAASVVVRPGGSATLLVSLKPGSYVLYDNLPWSYWKGTSVAFSAR